MALIQCPECGKYVSDQAPACPECGFPRGESTENQPPRRSPTLSAKLRETVFVILLLVVFFLTTGVFIRFWHG